MSLLPFLVILAAIVAFFQDEFASLFRRVFSYRWVRMLAPLAIVEVMVERSYDTFSGTLAWWQECLHAVMLVFFERCFPYTAWAAVLSQFLFLFGVSAFLVWAVWLGANRFSVQKNNHKITILYAFLWLFFLLLWVA